MFVIIVMLFQLINLYKDPDGVKVFSMGTTNVSEASQNRSSTNIDSAREISLLQQKIKNLQMELQVIKLLLLLLLLIIALIHPVPLLSQNITI